MSADDLLAAACDGDVLMIGKLLDVGVDPNAIDDQVGHSALYNATYTDHVVAMKALLDRGADPNLRLNYRSPIDGREERGVVALMYALSADAAKTLIQAGADLNATDEAGITPLMRAAHRANVEIVGLLLNKGADPCRSAKNGWRAIDFAQSQVRRYESWIVGRDRGPLSGKLDRLETICAMLSKAEQDRAM
jgi:ankyrin repeat protein